jgi:hypothetical protein
MAEKCIMVTTEADDHHRKLYGFTLRPSRKKPPMENLEVFSLM